MELVGAIRQKPLSNKLKSVLEESLDLRQCLSNQQDQRRLC